VDPDLIVYVAHGRLFWGRDEEGLAWLKEKNVPVLCPLVVLEPHEDWVKSQQGMAGGYMSMSVVMPELDGGIEPYAISAQYPGHRGLHVNRAVPERLASFTTRVENWLRLREKPNAEKKVAIFYIKGPGRNALVAEGLEIIPSLHNTLKYLREQGYDTGDLPEDEAEFAQRIQTEGPVLGPYAQGSFQTFLQTGNPELVPAETLQTWCREALPEELFQAMVDQYGPPPGRYFSTVRGEKPVLAISRVQFGNITLLPQPLPGVGSDGETLVHGVKKAPPYPYVGAYLWARKGLQADAIMHYGTHGSLEFTPWKQVALSQHDWPDALIGELPHLYLYSVSNPGEALIAKRRTYAVMDSHITPPFTDAELYGAFASLSDRLHTFSEAEDAALKEAYRTSIQQAVIELGLDKDLSLEGFADSAPADHVLINIHRYLHNLAEAKMP
ncbi:MAG: cobaltochelatase subunit CobN, partial [Verrucomicrobiota bacterium]